MTKRFEILIPNQEEQSEGRPQNYEVKADVREAGQRVLKALEQWGILGQGQIEALIFQQEMSDEKRVGLFFNGTLNGRHYRSSYKVLLRLEAAGLVHLHRYPNASLYTLTGRGHSYLAQRMLARLPGFRRSIAPGLVTHEVLTNGVGLVLSGLLDLPVSTEFERYILSRHAKDGARLRGMKLPDLWISDEAQPKAVEIERTCKDGGRYRRLWSAYRSILPAETVVLYIAAWPGGTKALLSRARDLLADFIYVCDIADFQKSLGTCAFVGYRGGEIRLEPLRGRPQETHSQRAATESPSARPGSAGPGDGLTVASSAAPPRFIRIGELIRPRGRPDQSASPLAMRHDPRPHPLSPSPSPEGGPERQEELSQ